MKVDDQVTQLHWKEHDRTFDKILTMQIGKRYFTRNIFTKGNNPGTGREIENVINNFRVLCDELEAMCKGDDCGSL